MIEAVPTPCDAGRSDALRPALPCAGGPATCGGPACGNCGRTDVALFQRGACRSCYRKLGDAGLPMPESEGRSLAQDRRRRAEWSAQVKRYNGHPCGLCGEKESFADGLCRPCFRRFREMGWKLPAKVLCVQGRWAELRRWVLGQMAGAPGECPMELVRTERTVKQLPLQFGGAK